MILGEINKGRIVGSRIVVNDIAKNEDRWDDCVKDSTFDGSKFLCGVSCVSYKDEEDGATSSWDDGSDDVRTLLHFNLDLWYYRETCLFNQSNSKCWVSHYIPPIQSAFAPPSVDSLLYKEFLLLRKIRCRF